MDMLKHRLVQAQSLEGDALVVALGELEGEITTASQSAKLSPYHQRQFEDLLKPLRERAKKGKIKTFAFSTKKKPVADSSSVSSASGSASLPNDTLNSSSNARVEEVTTMSGDADKQNNDTATLRGAGPVNKPATTLTRIHDEAFIGKDVEFRDLTGATIIVTVPLGALTLCNLKGCIVLVASVVRSSMVVRDVENCEFHARSKQVRIHTARNCSFYVNCVTPPIIEHSSGLRFGPYSLRLTSHTVVRDEAESMFNSDTAENFTKVKDFNWLKPKQSPNWTAIPSKRSGGFESLPDGVNASDLVGVEFD